MFIQSPHGLLRLLIPIYQQSGIDTLEYNRVSDTISHRVLFKRLKSTKSIEFISEKATYSKVIGISKNLRKDLRFSLPDVSKCKSPKDIFHLYRRGKINQIHFLARVGFTIDQNYKIFLRFVPEIPILNSAIRTFITEPMPIFMPINLWDGIISANEWNEKGIQIAGLGNKIYPGYGVWPPTNQEYLKLFTDYISSSNLEGTAVDLGSGSGVLGMILAKHGLNSFGVDNNFHAAKSSNLNAQRLGLDFTAVHGDANSIIIPECDVLVCNPPWIPAVSSSILDNGNYDPDENLLKASFSQTKKLKPNGRFLLIYSDLAQNLELQNKGRIEELCKENNLVIKNILSCHFPITLDHTHPLKPFRDKSFIYLYEIIRL